MSDVTAMEIKENMKGLIKLEQVALIVGVSAQTINNWYRWKKLHPEDERSKLLPDYIQDGARQTRYWTQRDALEICRFKELVVSGRNGFLGDVTQKHIRARKENKNGEKVD